MVFHFHQQELAALPAWEGMPMMEWLALLPLDLKSKFHPFPFATRYRRSDIFSFQYFHHTNAMLLH